MGELANQKKNLESILKTVGSQSRHKKELKSDLQSLQKYNEAIRTILKNQASIKKSTSTSTSTGKGIKNRIYYTNPKELVQRLKVLIGEVQAGNNSKHIKNEIADISHHLYRKKLIKKKEYNIILAHM